MFYMLYFNVYKQSRNVINNSWKLAQITHETEEITECWWAKAGTRKLEIVTYTPKLQFQPFIGYYQGQFRQLFPLAPFFLCHLSAELSLVSSP